MPGSFRSIPSKPVLERQLKSTLRGPGNVKKNVDLDAIEENDTGGVSAESLDTLVHQLHESSHTVQHRKSRINKKLRNALLRSASAVQAHCNQRIQIIEREIWQAFGNSSEVKPEDIEALLRPMASDSYIFRRSIHGTTLPSSCRFEIDHWMEANQIILGEGPSADFARRFFIMDSCTCVYPYMADAIACATRKIHPKILEIYEGWKQDH